MTVTLYDFVLLWIFHEGVKCLDNKVLGCNLLIRPRVQLYLYSGINGNFGLVKSWQINPKSIGTWALFVPLVPLQATHLSPIGLAQKANPIR